MRFVNSLPPVGFIPKLPCDLREVMEIGRKVWISSPGRQGTDPGLCRWK